VNRSLVLFVFAAGCGASVGPVATTARVRVAHVSPGAPAVDFCLAPHGTSSFAGPILAGAGRATGLSYSTVTRYFDVEAIRYDVRLVAPGAADCKQPLANLDDFTRLPELADGTSATIAAEGTLGGQGAAAFTLRAYVDDDDVAAGKARLRLIHASPGTPAVDVGTGGGALFGPVFDNVAFGGVATVETAPLAGVELSVRPDGGTQDVLSIEAAALPAGAIATAFAIGQLTSTDAPLRVLLCLDNGEPDGVHSQCTVLGGPARRARVRIAHLSPDAPPVDVCLAPTGRPFADQPLLRSLGATGLAYPRITTYVDLPAATYSVRVVNAIAPTCATPAIPDVAGLAVTAGLTATVAAIGDLEPSGHAANDPPLRLAVYADDTAITADKVKLRFIHASPGTPAVDVGLGTGAAFQRVFANVAFGKIAAHLPLENGYIQTGPFIQAVTARLAGAASDALTVPGVTLEPGTITTAFAIGGKTGDPHNPLRVLLCGDNRPVDGLLTSCTIAP
jgi:hypothetical protein